MSIRNEVIISCDFCSYGIFKTMNIDNMEARKKASDKGWTVLGNYIKGTTDSCPECNKGKENPYG
jgi:hypothetical protein